MKCCDLSLRRNCCTSARQKGTTGRRPCSLRAHASKKQNRKSFGSGKLASQETSDSSSKPLDQPRQPRISEEDSASQAASIGPSASSNSLNPLGSDLPEVSSDRIVSTCLTTSGLIAGVGLLIRGQASWTGPAILHTDPEAIQQLLQFPNFRPWHALVAAAATTLVTTARQVLLMRWPEFAEASDKSNQQVLRPLQSAEVAIVACVPAAAEEVLFRGALIPALLPDWRGVAIAGLIFGALHNSGGRNGAFAAWAAVVGVVYGAAFVTTEDLFVPIASHALSNLASAVIWKQRYLGIQNIDKQRS